MLLDSTHGSFRVITFVLLTLCTTSSWGQFRDITPGRATEKPSSENETTDEKDALVVMMGRKAGHLALGAAKAAGATLAVIPEDFADGPIRLEQVARILEGAVVKRLSMGRPYGVAVLALNTALLFGQLVVVSPIVACSPVFTALLGRWIFAEQRLTRRALVAIALVVPGVILVGLGR